jgi:alpha-L-fucosidase
LARTTELVDKYHPQLVWFDWWIEHAALAPYLPRFAAYYYNRAAQWQQGVAINYKWASFAEGSAVFDIERGQVVGIRPRFWQNDTSVSKHSWGYVQQQEYKTTTTLIGDLVDVVSKNGALLLNIGPRPDGTIPDEESHILREIGAWLHTNGEAIYNTRPWNVFGEGPTEAREGSFTDTQRHPFTEQDFRFTVGPNALYAICLGWPEHEVCMVALGSASPVSAAQIVGVTMLGADNELGWWQDAEGLHVQPPPMRQCEHAYTFKIMLHAT